MRHVGGVNAGTTATGGLSQTWPTLYITIQWRQCAQQRRNACAKFLVPRSSSSVGPLGAAIFRRQDGVEEAPEVGLGHVGGGGQVVGLGLLVDSRQACVRAPRGLRRKLCQLLTSIASSVGDRLAGVGAAALAYGA